MLNTNPRNRLSATAMLSSPDLRTKLQLDEIVTSFGHRIPSEQKENLMETIKVPLGNNLRKLGAVLPKPCYPDVRPNSPSSWTVAEQVKQRSSLLRSTDNSAAHIRMAYMGKATGLSDDTPVGFIPCSIPRPPAPRLSLASIPESKNNYNNPSRALYSHVPAINIPPKVNYVVQSRPALLNRYLVPQQPTGLPPPSQVFLLIDFIRWLLDLCFFSLSCYCISQNDFQLLRHMDCITEKETESTHYPELVLLILVD